MRDTVYSEDWLRERLMKQKPRSPKVVEPSAGEAPSVTVAASVRRGRPSTPIAHVQNLSKVLARHDYKQDLVQQLSFAGIALDPEFKIFETRRFRADWRVQGTKILIEFEGGLFAKGKQGHSSVTGILRDIEKYNLCALAGWTVIRVTPMHVQSGQALQWIEQALGILNAA